MITIDSDPVLNPVKIGAKVLLVISDLEVTAIPVEELYSNIRDEFEASYEVFTLALDWLYVIGAIELNDNGLIEYATS